MTWSVTQSQLKPPVGGMPQQAAASAPKTDIESAATLKTLLQTAFAVWAPAMARAGLEGMLEAIGRRMEAITSRAGPAGEARSTGVTQIQRRSIQGALVAITAGAAGGAGGVELWNPAAAGACTLRHANPVDA